MTATSGITPEEVIDMPRFIDRAEVQRLVDAERAQLVEVLPEDEYRWAHLPGAVHVPLKAFDVSVLDRSRPVVVYCNNTECDMSPRAAWRLEDLGFDAYDYVAGKMDWLSFDLPYEGDALLVGRAVERDVPVVRLGERAADARARATEGLPVVVVNGDDVVMGVVAPDGLDGVPADALVDDHLRFGVSTVRPSEDTEALLHRMHHAGADNVVVSCSDGRFVGVLTATRAAAALESGDGEQAGLGAGAARSRP